MSKKLLIAGNWKLNGEKKDISFIKNLLKFHSKKLNKKVDILICPPFTLIDKFCQLTQRSNIEIGGQDCSQNETGAYTGEVSAKMLNDFFDIVPQLSKMLGIKPLEQIYYVCVVLLV